MSFRDRYGNLKANSWQSTSENPTTFNVCLYFSQEYKGYPTERILRLVMDKYFENDYEWRTMENDSNSDWSLDEKISALAYLNRRDRAYLKTIPIFANPFKNSSWLSWLRPDVLAYTLLIKYPIFKSVLLPVIYKKINTSIVDYLDSPESETSGIQLAFIMLMGINDLEKIEEIGTILNFKDVFNIYYPEKTHPIRRIWNE